MALLEVESVSRTFGGLVALESCSLDVEEGQVAGLIGPNGSGKTTLFNVLTGYVRPDGGHVRLRGVDITGASPAKVFGLGVGRTFQLTRIFARLSVLENMLVATQRREGWLRSVVKGQSSPAERGRAMELLEFVGIHRLARSPAGHLSYGQRKLLELAYVLVADPVIILLDEPAGGVNPTLVNVIADRIRALNALGKTFLVVEHNLEFVMGLCHRVTVMDQGSAIVSGAPDVIRTDPRVLDAYLGGSDDEDGHDEDGPDGVGPDGDGPRGRAVGSR
jgi:neutral amino acid transport system ATP-binding protein